MKVGSARTKSLHWKRRRFVGVFVFVFLLVLFVNRWLLRGDRGEDVTLLVPPLEKASKPLDHEVPCVGFPSASLFRPTLFMEDGAGRDYLELYHTQSRGDSRRRRLLKVRFVLYNLATKHHCRPIYYHIHKNGGSTMNIVQSTDSQNVSGGNVQAYYTPLENQLGRDRFEEETRRILQEARDNRNGMPVFTFVRDPVPRFLSGVGQALKLNGLGPCSTKDDTTPRKDSLGLLECVLNQIQGTQQQYRYLDEHLEPQIFELYHGMMGLGDLPVHVMDLPSAMDVVLQTVLGHQQASRRRTTHGSVVAAAGYNLSLSILTPQLVERICSVYRMDVLFLQETNVTSTACSMLLPSLLL
jgi:hypothetical protein